MLRKLAMILLFSIVCYTPQAMCAEVNDGKQEMPDEPEKFNWSGLPHHIKWKIMELVGFKNNVPKSLGSHTVDLENKRLGGEKSVLSPDGKKIAFVFVKYDRSFGRDPWRTQGWRNQVVKIWDIEREAVVEKFVCEDNVDVSCMAWHPTDNRLAIGIRPMTTMEVAGYIAQAAAGTLIILDNTLSKVSEARQNGIEAIDWHPNGTELAVAGSRGVKICDAQGLQDKTTVTSEWCNKVRWNKQGDKLLFCQSDRKRRVVVWDVESGKITGKIKPSAGDNCPKIEAVDWHSDGRTVAVGTHSGSVLVWDSETGRIKASYDRWCQHSKRSSPFLLPCHHGCFNHKEITNVKWHPEEGHLAAASKDRELLFRGTGRSNYRDERDDAMAGVLDIGWNEDNKEFVVCAADKVRRYKHEIAVSPESQLDRVVEGRKVGRKTFMDPLKLLLIMQKLDSCVQKKQDFLKGTPYEIGARMIQIIHGNMDQLKRLGFSDAEITEMIVQSKDMLLGPEGYDYFRYLQGQLPSLGCVQIGERGKDVHLEEFLTQNRVVEVGQDAGAVIPENVVPFPEANESDWNCAII